MSAVRAELDVSRLPTTVFGDRGLLWWGTLRFIAIEGTTLVATALTYVYLQRNFVQWPPAGIPRPGLLAPAVQAGLMVASLLPAGWLDRAGRHMDLAAMRRWLVVLSGFALAFVVMRWFELEALHVRGDTSAYGSVAWGIVVAHSTLVVVQLFEIAAFTAMVMVGPVEEKYFSDANDVALYWYFLTLVWLPLAGLVYLYPNRTGAAP